FLHKLYFLLAVKAGGMRVSKKQESGPVEKNAKAPGKEKTRYCTAGLGKILMTCDVPEIALESKS
uniref:Uncharacterized protein n=1 Tax=Bubo bubo TaxID=30461 RepID=A0A8C0F7B6_BUBBB